ncbi:MAG: hypothetical protein GY820_42105 [Gammaproteobacteria bacterium]|nr:hypothetical protein [Gammaproteobacteria bacterium]
MASPVNSGRYLSNFDCSYLITVASNKAVILTIAKFSTEFRADFLRIYDGSDSNARLILE